MKSQVAVTGKVRVSVFSEAGRVSRTGWQSNMVLDQGLLGVASRTWANSFLYCALGSGNTAAAAGQTGLVAESFRSGQCVAGACGSAVSGSQVTLQRTFRLPTNGAVAPVTYKEVGLSWSPSHGSNLFSRIVLSSPLVITTGQWPEIEYQLVLTLSPATGTPGATTLTDLTAIGAHHNWQAVCFDGVDVNGLTVHNLGLGGSSSCMEPSVPGAFLLSPTTTQPAAFGSDVPRSGLFGGPRAFTLGTATLSGGTVSRVKTVTITRSEAVASWSSFGVTDGTRNGYVMVFSSPVAHPPNVDWVFNFTVSWSRG